MINQNISRYRKKRGLTQEQLAEKIGVTGQTVSKWENGVSSPDVSVLPDLAATLGVDMNALFDDQTHGGERIRFERLPEVCYDRVLTLYLKAVFDFYGWKELENEQTVREKVEKLKADFASGLPRCGYSIDEGATEHGAVFVSDAFTAIDRGYGSPESALLFDMDKAGAILSVLGRRNCRKVLKEVYYKRITQGEAADGLSAEEIADRSELTVEAVREAAADLVHMRLLDEIEEIRQGDFRRAYLPMFAGDFMYVLAILRLAHLATSNMTSTFFLYRDAIGHRNYEGPGL